MVIFFKILNTSTFTDESLLDALSLSLSFPLSLSLSLSLSLLLLLSSSLSLRFSCSLLLRSSCIFCKDFTIHCTCLCIKIYFGNSNHKFWNSLNYNWYCLLTSNLWYNFKELYSGYVYRKLWTMILKNAETEILLQLILHTKPYWQTNEQHTMHQSSCKSIQFKFYQNICPFLFSALL